MLASKHTGWLVWVQKRNLVLKHQQTGDITATIPAYIQPLNLWFIKGFDWRAKKDHCKLCYSHKSMCMCIHIYKGVFIGGKNNVFSQNLLFREAWVFSESCFMMSIPNILFLLHSHWLNERVSTRRADFIHTSHRCLFGVTAKYDPVEVNFLVFCTSWYFDSVLQSGKE